MKVEEYEKIIDALDKIDKISRNLDQIYNNMRKNTESTPLSILDTFEKYTVPMKNLDLTIKFYDDLIDYLKTTNNSMSVLNNYAKEKNKTNEKDVHAVKACRNIKVGNSSISKYKSITIVRKQIDVTENIFNSLFNVIKKRFFSLIKDNLLHTLSGLDQMSLFLIEYGNKSEIVEKYMSMYINEYSFKKDLSNNAKFVERVVGSSELFENIKRMNMFLFPAEVHEMLNRNMIHLLKEDMKTNIFRLLNLIDRRNDLDDIFTVFSIYKVVKNHDIDMLGYLDTLFRHFFRYIDDVSSINEKPNVEEFVVYAGRIVQSFDECFLDDYIEHYGKNFNVSTRAEFEDKIMLTLYMKIKHLSLSMHGLKKNLYLLNNVNYLMKIRNNIGDIALFDDLQKYKKEIINTVKDDASKCRGNSTKFVNTTMVFFKENKLPKEMKNYMLENIKKIFKEITKQHTYDGNIDDIIKKLDGMELH